MSVRLALIVKAFPLSVPLPLCWLAAVHGVYASLCKADQCRASSFCYHALSRLSGFCYSASCPALERLWAVRTTSVKLQIIRGAIGACVCYVCLPVSVWFP